MKENPMSIAERQESLHPFKLSLFIFLTDFLVTIIFSVLLFPEPEYGNNIGSYALWEQILLLLILAPLAETYIFQKLFLEGMILLTNRKWLSVLLIAILFGLAHNYSVPYMTKAFIAGLLYCYLYLTVKNKGANAYWYTVFAHFIFNLVAFLLNSFTEI